MSIVRVTVETISGTGRRTMLAQQWKSSKATPKQRLAEKIASQAVMALITPTTKGDTGE